MKKKKKDKLVNGHMEEATDMNGNNNGVETPGRSEEERRATIDSRTNRLWPMTFFFVTGLGNKE